MPWANRKTEVGDRSRFAEAEELTRQRHSGSPRGESGIHNPGACGYGSPVPRFARPGNDEERHGPRRHLRPDEAPSQRAIPVALQRRVLLYYCHTRQKLAGRHRAGRGGFFGVAWQATMR